MIFQRNYLYGLYPKGIFTFYHNRISRNALSCSSASEERCHIWNMLVMWYAKTSVGKNVETLKKRRTLEGAVQIHSLMPVIDGAMSRDGVRNGDSIY
jgi:hypothetical protein